MPGESWSDMVLAMLGDLTPDPFVQEAIFTCLRGQMGYTVALAQWHAGARETARELLKRELDELTQ